MISESMPLAKHSIPHETAAPQVTDRVRNPPLGSLRPGVAYEDTAEDPKTREVSETSQVSICRGVMRFDNRSANGILRYIGKQPTGI